MKRELGQPIMSHDNPIVDDLAEVLDGLNKPKRPGEIEIDLTSTAEAISEAFSLVNRGRLRIAKKVGILLTRAIRPEPPADIDISATSPSVGIRNS